MMTGKFRVLGGILMAICFALAMAFPVTASTISQPDLVIRFVSAPQSAIPYQKITLFATVENAGSRISSFSYVYFYLSGDAIADLRDLYLGKSLVTSLLPGNSHITSSSATIPEVPPGSYYIIAIADGSDRIAEIDEINNAGISVPLEIGASNPPIVPTIAPTSTGNIPPRKPDLVITKSNALSSKVLGGKVTLITKVKNKGEGSSLSSSLFFYLSNDTVLDPTDPFLGSSQVTSLLPGNSKTILSTAIIPSKSSGVFYILSKADGSDMIPETDEENNVGVSNQLAIDSHSVPTPVPTVSIPITTAPTHAPPVSPLPSPSPTQAPETFGAEPNPTGNPLGGGSGYGQVYADDDARITYIVRNKAEFLSALENIKAGEVIYVPENANINLTGVMGTSVPGGVTIAGNRGVNGSEGGRIYQNRLADDPDYGGPTRTMLHIVGDNVRITGLRLEGPDKGTSALGEGVRKGIYVNQYTSLEVDNCELWGWSWSAVHLVDRNNTSAMYVHHNTIHHCQADGYGYGVCVSGGTMLVEGNMFDYTRHAVAASGLPGESYEARYNLLGSHSTNHVFDVHEYSNPSTGELIAGRLYRIHHNTVNVSSQYSVVIRAVPVDGAWIDHNTFQWRTISGERYAPVAQANGAGNIYMIQNLIGTPEVLYPSGPIMQL